MAQHLKWSKKEKSRQVKLAEDYLGQFGGPVSDKKGAKLRQVCIHVYMHTKVYMQGIEYMQAIDAYQAEAGTADTKGDLLLATCYLLLTTYHPPPTTYHSPPTTHHPPLTTLVQATATDLHEVFAEQDKAMSGFIDTKQLNAASIKVGYELHSLTTLTTPTYRNTGPAPSPQPLTPTPTPAPSPQPLTPTPTPTPSPQPLTPTPTPTPSPQPLTHTPTPIPSPQPLTHTPTPNSTSWASPSATTRTSRRPSPRSTPTARGASPSSSSSSGGTRSVPRLGAGPGWSTPPPLTTHFLLLPADCLLLTSYC
jgi:hypothetical protein